MGLSGRVFGYAAESGPLKFGGSGSAVVQMRTLVCTSSTAQHCCHCRPTALDSTRTEYAPLSSACRPLVTPRDKRGVGDVPAFADRARDATARGRPVCVAVPAAGEDPADSRQVQGRGRP